VKTESFSWQPPWPNYMGISSFQNIPPEFSKTNPEK